MSEVTLSQVEIDETATSGLEPADSGTTRRIVPGAEWETLYAQLRCALPESFDGEGQPLNLVEGEWSQPGDRKLFSSPCDGTSLCSYPMLDHDAARRAVQFAAREHAAWEKTDLDERRARVTNCVAQLKVHRELLAYLLVWEIGKPYAQSLVSVDRCISGVEWYVEQIEGMMTGRRPLGLISNIASWNYPLSVLMHAVLIQVLAGNAVIAKTPTDGGLCTLTLAFGLARRCGLPVSLLSGSGSVLSEALVRDAQVSCLAFVGGRSSGRDIAAGLVDQEGRYMMEMEGVNAYGIWEFSDWDELAKQTKKGFEYGKQRCTAYTRFVVQRRLFPRFLATYLPVLNSIQFGHPLLTADGQEHPPALAFGPLINSRSADDVRGLYEEALNQGAISIYEGEYDESLFFPGQDRSAYVAPAALLNVPRNCALYHREPFGPLDSIVVVDRIEELISEMNVSNGSLVASIGCDDPEVAQRIAGELRSFKVGINRVRSRGDREEPFGGIGESWKGCFVGGEYVVRAVTQGEPNEQLYGNFPEYTLVPEKR